MSITLDHPNFKSASFIYSNIKRDLSSFDSANQIDEGEFPRYISDVIRSLGLGVYKEQDVILKVANYQAQLPTDFSKVYAVYKCSPFINVGEKNHYQGTPISIYNDVTWEIIKPGKDTVIDYTHSEQYLERVTVRQYVKEKPVEFGFQNFVLLRPSPNVKREFFGDDCQNILSSSPLEFSISQRTLTTNFSQDWVFIKYYAFPKDEDGVPEVPDILPVEKAIEWYIKYQLLMNMWLNNSSPDLQNRWQYAESQYGFWAMEAKKYLQTPAFHQMVNNIRRERNVNKITIFSH